MRAYAVSCLEVDGRPVFGLDGDSYIYIGSIANPFDSNSIANEFGAGNPYSSYSIANEFGQFGNPYQSTSATNDLAFEPPVILSDDLEIIAYLTTNDVLFPAINPYVAIACAKESYASADADLDGLEIPEDLIGRGAAPALPSHPPKRIYTSPPVAPTPTPPVAPRVSPPTPPPTPACPSNASRASDGKCTCNSGFEANAAKSACVKVIACPVNSVRSGDHCTCNSGFSMIDGICVTAQALCERKFGTNSVAAGGSCGCASGYEFNASMTACVEGIVCPANAVRSGEACSCKAGYVRSSTGECISQIQACVAKYGEGASYNGTACACAPGLEFDGGKASCVPSIRVALSGMRLRLRILILRRPYLRASLLVAAPLIEALAIR